MRASIWMATCLVKNSRLDAVKLTREGLVEGRLAQTEGLVRDARVGITPKELSHIFKLGYRGSQSCGIGPCLYVVSLIDKQFG
jgi:hypothetical protein